MMDSDPSLHPHGPTSSTPVPTDALLRHPFRQRKGSLPFKKRRLFDTLQPLSTPSGLRSMLHPVTPSPHRTMSMMDSSDETIAALALVAAAASPLMARSVSEMAPSDEDRATPVNPILMRNNDVSLLESSVCKLVSPEVTHSIKELPPPSPSPGGSRRVHHPPLLAPNPNGCHGITSRNNSYCRRTPCYKNSKFCKLHYQQYLVSGNQPTEEEPSSIDLEEQATATTTTPSTSSTSGVTFQDRRFSGLSGERRCSATTTRGRSCAYVAVNDTQYCYLHADYDNNPPPRRGGASTTILMAQAGLLSSNDPKFSVKTPLVPPLKLNTLSAPCLHSSPPSVTSEESNSSHLATQDAHVVPAAGGSPYPMLSSVSSNHWYDLKVLITTGPLINRVGRVTRWGNGWVSVQVLTSSGEIAQGLVHNRRSVELLLVPEDHPLEPMPSQSKSLVVEHSGMSYDTEDSPLKRCVSNGIDGSSLRKAGTAFLSVANDEAAAEQQFMSPCVSDSVDENDKVTNNHSNIDDGAFATPALSLKTTPLGDVSQKTAPDEQITALASLSKSDSLVVVDMAPPEPAKHQSVTMADTLEGKSVAEGATEHARNASRSSFESVRTKPLASTDITSLPSEENRESCSLPSAITPTQYSSSDGHTPGKEKELGQVLTTEGRGRKHSLDLLFGTAALDRSRRKVQKPSRYEDTAMLEKAIASQQVLEGALKAASPSPRKRGYSGST